MRPSSCDNRLSHCIPVHTRKRLLDGDKCDIINSEGDILFGDQLVLITLFRFTVNLICPVVCTAGTIIGPLEEAVIPANLDAATQYVKGQPLLLEPRCAENMDLLIVAHVLITYTSAVIPILVSNFSNRAAMILKHNVLADDTPVC